MGPTKVVFFLNSTFISHAKGCISMTHRNVIFSRLFAIPHDDSNSNSEPII